MSKVTILKRQASEIGWREMVSLPELGLQEIKAKIDTGARTSAIHAADVVVSGEPGNEWAEFSIPEIDDSQSNRFKAKIVDQREIRNTGGEVDSRLIIRTKLVLGRLEQEIELSLADREKMRFPIIIGRTAIRGKGILVNPSRSFLATRRIEVRRKRMGPDPSASL